MSAAAPAAHSLRFRPDIEGLRAIAVGAVVASHLALGLPGGFIGVDVFFVISGYLITGLMIKEHGRTGRVSLRQFYLRRARRILPAAVLCLTATVLVSRVLLNPGAAVGVRRDGLWSLGFVENVHLIRAATDYFQQGFAPSPLQHYWSLSVEEQFYLVWPALFLLVAGGLGSVRLGPARLWLRRVGAAALLLAAGSFAWALWLTATSPARAYFSGPARVFELGAGALAACWAARHPLGAGERRSRVAGVAGLTLIGAAAVLIGPGDPYPGIRALLPTIGAVLVLLAGLSRGGPASAVLSLPPVRFVGRISYSVYLWHWPLIVLLGPRLGSGALRVLALLALTLLLSTLSYYFVELPFLGGAPGRARGEGRPARLGLGHRAWPATLSVALLIAATFTVLPALLPQGAPASTALAKADPGTPVKTTRAELVAYRARWQAAVAAAARTRQLPPDLNPSLETMAQRRAWQPSLCHRSPCHLGTGPRQALLIGNSLAQVSGPVVTGALDLDKWTVTLQWKSHCEIAVSRHCPQLRRLAVKHVDLLVLSDRAYEAPGFGHGDIDRLMVGELRYLATKADHVVYLGEPPGMASPLVDCVDAKLRTPRSCLRTPAQVAHINSVKRAAVRAAGGVFVDPTPWLCSGNACPAVIGSHPVYVDTVHLEARLAAKLAPLFRLALLDAGLV